MGGDVGGDVGVTGTLPGVGVTVAGTSVEASVGASRVLIGVRKTGAKGVKVARGVAPACKSGQGCRSTGNSRQLELSEQTFKLKVVNCAPRQMTILWSFTMSAVRHVTGEEETTSKDAKAGKTSMTWVSSATQNWHCMETKFSPVIGITGVMAVFTGVAGMPIVGVG